MKTDLTVVDIVHCYCLLWVAGAVDDGVTQVVLITERVMLM